SGKTVKVWNIADAKETATLVHPADVTSLSFNGDKTRIVTGAADNQSRVWDMATGKELQFFSAAGPARGVAFHSANRTIMAGSADKTPMVRPAAGVRVVAASAQPIRGLAFAPSGSHILTASDDKTVKPWNLGNGVAERTLTGAEGALSAVAVA